MVSVDAHHLMSSTALMRTSTFSVVLMVNRNKDDSPGDFPVDHSAKGQSELKDKEARTSHQPGAVQRNTVKQMIQDNQNGRQELEANGANSFADSGETTDAIRHSPQAKKRNGKTAVGKLGQGAMKAPSGTRYVKVFDNYSDISPREKGIPNE